MSDSKNFDPKRIMKHKHFGNFIGNFFREMLDAAHIEQEIPEYRYDIAVRYYFDGDSLAAIAQDEDRDGQWVEEQCISAMNAGIMLFVNHLYGDKCISTNWTVRSPQLRKIIRDLYGEILEQRSNQ